MLNNKGNLIKAPVFKKNYKSAEFDCNNTIIKSNLINNNKFIIKKDEAKLNKLNIKLKNTNNDLNIVVVDNNNNNNYNSVSLANKLETSSNIPLAIQNNIDKNSDIYTKNNTNNCLLSPIDIYNNNKNVHKTLNLNTENKKGKVLIQFLIYI